MENLKNDWLTDGLIDFEYKKYVVLGYLKVVKNYFRKNQLFPYLSDLMFHYNSLIQIRDNKALIYENFPKKISKVDFEKLTLTYKKIIEDDKIMSEIEEIVSYSMPQFEATLNQGKEVYEFIKSNVSITPIGITPMYSREGYLLLNQGKSRDVNIYRYRLAIFYSKDEEYKGIDTEFLLQSTYSITRPFEKIKRELIKKFTEMPNPATFLIRSTLKVPIPQTLLPIAKSKLVREISNAA